MIILIAIAVFAATLLGGYFALRFRDRLHLIVGFSAGAVIGVAFFDLLPEALELGGAVYSVSTITAMIALGFVLFMILDRVFSLHAHSDDGCNNLKHKSLIGAGSLSTHSFIDGLAVGLAFNVSTTAGIIVAFAVLAHDFSDGINTVSIIIKNKGSRKEALRWLFIDALAPVLGIIVSQFISVEESTLGLLLAVFCGFFFYLGASDLLPESHHNHPTHWTTIATIAGVAFLYIIIQLAPI
jgi:zinc transporter ZupT